MSEHRAAFKAVATRRRSYAAPLKAVERWGRRLVLHSVAALLARRRKPVVVPARARLLVLRFDARLGNMVLLTPVLETLKAQFPDCIIDVLGGSRGAQVLASHPAVHTFMAYDKAALWRASGPVRTLWRLRRRAYDVCLDVSNPTDPSVTHALIARLSGAVATIGSAQSGFGRLFTAPVDTSGHGPHEIDLRLALLAPLQPTRRVRQVSLGPLAPAHDAPVRAFARQRLQVPFAVVNLGARLAAKRLKAADYAVVAYALMASGLRPVLTFGPDEAEIAAEVAILMPDAIVAPKTDVAELAFVMAEARCVVSCDTGPMHLAVALGRPTCGLFVTTSMARFGYPDAPHACVEVAGRPAEVWMPLVRSFIEGVARAPSVEAVKKRA